MLVDDTGVFDIFEYKIDFKSKCDETIIVYNSKTGKTFEVPYEVYFERFGDLIKELEKESKIELNTSESIYDYYYEKFGDLMRKLEKEFEDKGE